jgi:hypothetical protein
MNKQGRRTVEQVGKLRVPQVRFDKLATEQDELVETLPGFAIGDLAGDAGKSLRELSASVAELADVGDEYAEEWHSFLHDDAMPPEGVMEYKRGWLEWGKLSMSITPLAKRPDEKLTEFALAVGELQ